MAITYSTWNPADKGAAITLSNGNLTAAASTANGVRSTISVSTGKWYWEMTIDSSLVNNIVAIGDSTTTLANSPGQDTHAWGYFEATGQSFHNAALAAYGSSYTTGDVIGVALDAGGGSVTFYKNNVSQGALTLTGVSTPYFAMTGSGGTTSQATANFGATALTYAPPAGYNSGLYSGSNTTAGFLLKMI